MVASSCAGCTGASHTAGVRCSDQLRILPVSNEKKSCTRSCQSPSALTPVKPDSAFAGEKLPVKGALAETTDWMLLPAASSSTVWQKLLPPPSVLLMTSTSVASGATSVTVRSFTNE